MESSQFTNSQSRYEAIEPLERQGATCDTFRVKVYGKLHFLKRLKAEHAGDIRYQEALRKEFETGYRLEHPNLVRYISMGDDGILMEYVDGETLTQRLATQPDYFRKRKNTDKFLRQLLSVLDYLHSHQVLHLDLKPDNILLTRINDDVKLIDLGCCYSDSFPDTTGHTDGFAAPEQLTGGMVDVRTDIYAIGKVLELFPNHHIYNKVITRCTASDPASRYQTISELQETLSTRRTYTPWLVLMLLVVVLSIGYFIFTSRERQPAEVVEPQTETIIEKPETIKVSDDVHSVGQNEKEVASIEHQETTPEVLAPIKSELSEEENTFLSHPHLRIASSDEFDRYKQKLDEYYRDANAFLNDTANFQRYPSHVSYLRRYQEIIQRTKERIETDDWFRPLYKSPMNPVSFHTRKYKEDLEHRAFVNGNKLP